MGWTNSPQYLKHLQKIRSMDPEKRAVTQGLIDDLAGYYAGADMQKQLQASRAATLEKQRERDLSMGQQRLDLSKTQGENRYNLARRGYRQDKNLNRTAEILGWANLPLTALTGYNDYQQKKKLTGLFQGLADKRNASY